ncbi:putative Nucleotide pyrophosphatase/phosphodiesterase [Tripterygium wilfordii]|uniref:Purple acid phosphatase n=1 Tax=Tripterygium wilfordii TaxID=458696 RepID=A0A7J7DH98_TRIWF|nr:probable inactive purple acid phosphatase 2 [Tripterygium wilfordii]KAF5745436.1 putative Nucleotide pyrophosphatase/phosphodiesterase [Tripterygium wilfordii]
MIPLILLSLLLLPPPSLSEVTISVSPKTLAKSGDTIQIQWSGVESPSKLDWLGLYSPPDSRHDNFIGYKFLSSSPSWKSGSGSISMPLINLRSNYSLRIFRWTESEVNPNRHDHDQNPLPGTAHLLAKSEEVGFFGSDDRVEQIHLAYTDNEEEMRVMFVTGDREERYVRYGLEDGAFVHVAATRVDRYEREHMCDRPANESTGWRDPGWIHDAVMKDLKKGVRYYYQVGSDSKGWSETHSFMSRNEDLDETVAFLFGDMGTATPYSTFIRTQDESISTIKWILRDIKALGDRPAFVSHIGDISYARGYAWVWDNFFAQIESVASKVPYHVCIGNHEYDWPLQPWRPDWSYSIYGTDGGGECGVPYSLRFNMPGNSSEPSGNHAPATRNLYYSFNVGIVHFVYMSTETNFLPGSRQYEFIKHDLESVNRSKTPFVVVQGHRPMYTTSHENRDAPFREKMLEHLEPLFVKNNVTLALWGHVHRYERFCPINNFTCGSLGLSGEDWKAFPVHVVIGMAGQDWQPIWEPRPDHQDLPIFPQPERSLYRGGEFGYTRLFATKEKLTLSYVGNHDGEVHDMVEILASGQVLSGGGDVSLGSVEGVESSFSWYVKGASVLLLGAFMGYILGFISHTRKQNTSTNSWTPVKSEDI